MDGFLQTNRSTIQNSTAYTPANIRQPVSRAIVILEGIFTPFRRWLQDAGVAVIVVPRIQQENQFDKQIKIF